MAPTTDTNLLALQGNVKRDPESYEEEFKLQFRHYQACLAVFSMKPSEESQQFANLVTFVAQVASCYPDMTANFASDISNLLDKHYAILNPSLRQTLVKALILLRNRKQVAALDLLPLFFRLFRCQDKSLRQLLFRHIIADIKAANQKHNNVQLNRSLQNFLYSALEDPHEAAAKKSLAVLIELWQRQVWRDARTVNVIASAAVHSSTRIMLAALKFFLGQDEVDPADSDAEDDEETPALPQPSKADVYKATKKGTTSSKKKKEKKLARVMAAVKKQKRKTTKNHDNFAAIQLLHDPQKFAEELFKRLNKSTGERFEVRLVMMSVISRVTGVHKLLLLNFYPFLQKYVLPHQRDAPTLLAVLVQSVHDEVPPDALTPVLRQLVDQFVHDRARPEVMSLGLKTVRSLCERAPLIMTPELLQDLALYKKFREKEVASAARSLITLFREIAPAMLEKKDRGRDADLEAAPLAFGAHQPSSRVEGADLLQAAIARGDQSSSEEGEEDSDGDDCLVDSDSNGEELDSDAEEGSASDAELVEEHSAGEAEGKGSGSDLGDLCSEDSEEEDGQSDAEGVAFPSASGDEGDSDPEAATPPMHRAPAAKRKLGAQEGSLGSLKKELAEAQAAKKARVEAEQPTVSEQGDEAAVPLEYERILTEEDFARIRELRHKKMVGQLMRKHGLKSSSKRDRLLAVAEEEAEEAIEKQDKRSSVAEQRMHPDDLRGKHKSRKSKAEKLASVVEGRQGREFGAAQSRKNKKTGGKSNKEKLKGKNLPLGARKNVVRRRNSKQKVGKKNFSSKKTLR